MSERIAGRNNILGSIPKDRGRYYDGDDIDLLMEEDLDAKWEEEQNGMRQEAEDKAKEKEQKSLTPPRDNINK
jgi:hypothetical protein